MQRISKNFHSKHFHSCPFWNCGSFTSHSKMARSRNSTAASLVANATTTWLYSIWFHSIWLIQWYPLSFVVALEVCTEQYCCWICIAKSNSLFGFFCLLSGSGLVSDGYLLRMKKERKKERKTVRIQSNRIASQSASQSASASQLPSQAKQSNVPLLRRNRRVRLHCCQPWLQEYWNVVRSWFL